MTYELIGTYLKGFHLTLASIYPERDQEGWKVNKREWLAYLHNSWDEGNHSTVEYTELYKMSIKGPTSDAQGHQIMPPPPKEVRAVPRLKLDLEALE
jgi:hypothetical protein